jgi:oligopeptidase B
MKTHKINSISDFISCADFLIRERYSSSERLALEGGSAGGILVGGALIANITPDGTKQIRPFRGLHPLDQRLPLSLGDRVAKSTPANGQDARGRRSKTPPLAKMTVMADSE